MKQIAFGCLAVMGIAAIGLTPVPADARGGVNASYGRAYCAHLLNKAATAARRYSQKAPASSHRTRDREHNRQTPEYWRRVHRECLKENGY